MTVPGFVGIGRSLCVATGLLLVLAWSSTGTLPPEPRRTADPSTSSLGSTGVRDAPQPAAEMVWPGAVVAEASVTASVERAGYGGSRHGIPVVALLAYRTAAEVMDEAEPDCGLSWTVLAAVGRVESDHGRFGGALLEDDGVSTPLIRGVRLDGRGSVARVPDTDGGQVDGDELWDRAVGPMQFLPSTWSVVAVDADVDGVRSPDDLDDAALGAAVYLCATGHDLSSPDGLGRALLAYNPSTAYARAVMRLERLYRAGAYSLIQGYADAVAGVYSMPLADQAVSSRQDDPRPSKGARAGSEGDVSGDPVDSPTEEPPTEEPPTEEPPTEEPPTEEPPAEEPPTEEPPTEEPPTEEPPTEVVLTGLLETCSTGFCLAGQVLDVGTDDVLAAPALADHDLDGVLGPRRDELTGLLGQVVTITGAESPGGTVVTMMNGSPFR